MLIGSVNSLQKQKYALFPGTNCIRQILNRSKGINLSSLKNDFKKLFLSRVSKLRNRNGMHCSLREKIGSVCSMVCFYVPLQPSRIWKRIGVMGAHISAVVLRAYISCLSLSNLRVKLPFSAVAVLFIVSIHLAQFYKIALYADGTRVYFQVPWLLRLYQSFELKTEIKKKENNFVKNKLTCLYFRY